MANVSAEYRHIIKNLSRTADAGIRNARLEETARVGDKYWQHWTKLAGIMGVDPYLDPGNVTYNERVRALTVFGAAVRSGVYGNRKRTASATVSSAISAVGQEIAMAGGTDFNPVKISGTDKFLQPIDRMLKGFRNDDPATVKKLPIEVDVPEFLVECAEDADATPLEKRVADLTLVAFYYLLRVGEYTSRYRNSKEKPSKGKGRARKKKRKKKTVNFRVADVTFFKKNSEGNLRQLPHDASPTEIMSADGATLRLTNQKNGWKNVCIHQQVTGHARLCGVRALGRIILEIREFTSSSTEWLSAFQGKKGVQHVTPKDISRALKAAASDLEYDTKRGIPIDRIDSHSLRAGGANSLSLAGFSEHEIQIMGRWRSATFKEYISDQLSSFTDGMAKAMSKTFQFVNIAAGTLTDVTASLVPAAA